MERVIPERAARKLARRKPLPVDPSSSIAVKRDVQEYIVELDASTFIAGFRDTLTSAESTFGLIRVKRPVARLGQPFALAERFQGCFSLELLLRKMAGRRTWLQALVSSRALRWLLRVIEDALLSNYGEISEMALTDTGNQPARLVYSYLEGTPIAGRSVFTIEQIGPRRSLFRQTLEYQEINGISLATFQRFGLKFHNQVVHEEVRQAAARAGGGVRGTIPRAYATMANAGAAE